MGVFTGAASANSFGLGDQQVPHEPRVERPALVIIQVLIQFVDAVRLPRQIPQFSTVIATG